MDKDKQTIYTVDVFEKGLAFGKHNLTPSEDPRVHCSLRLDPQTETARLQSKYILGRNNPLVELEKHMMKLSERGVLARSTIYLGVDSDPFYPFEGKFEKSMHFLELFKKYQPGSLYIQTRSPLIVIAMPIFSALGSRCSVTVGIETDDEASVARYTPHLPRVSERLKTVRALKKFGIETNIQVSPVLPYGDWRKGAASFAELLVDNGDYIFCEALSNALSFKVPRLRKSLLAQKLAEDRKFHWLRPDAAEPLLREIELLAPEKLSVPKRKFSAAKQLEMFAA